MARETPPKPRGDYDKQIRPYVESFGEQGYVYFGKGMSLPACYKAELSKREATISELRETIAQRDEAITDMEARLSSCEDLTESTSVRKTLADTPTGKLASAIGKK